MQKGVRLPPSRTRRPNQKKKKGRSLRWGRIAAIAGVLLALIALCLVWIFVWTPQREKEKNLSAHPLRYREEVLAAAEEFDIEPVFLAGLVMTESSFRADAVSGVGAVGLMQIMPDTATWLAGKLELTDIDATALTDPTTNLRLGCWYLRFLLDRYNEQEREALTAYIAGQGSVDKWLADPAYSQDGVTLSEIPGRDTAAYADRVLEARAAYLELYGPNLEEEGQ